MPGSTVFTDAMALTPAGDGVYEGELNEHWTIGAKVHGGAMLALCAKRGAEGTWRRGTPADCSSRQFPVGA